MSDEQDDIDLDRLEREYFHLQEEILSFDSKALTIKAWSVSVAGAIAGSSALAGNRTVLLFAALVSIMFWFIEASWKAFQYANYKRVNDIESFMRGSGQDLELWQISKSWNASYHRDRSGRLLKLLFWPHVVVPHGAMAAILLLFYFFLPVGG